MSTIPCRSLQYIEVFAYCEEEEDTILAKINMHFRKGSGYGGSRSTRHTVNSSDRFFSDELTVMFSGSCDELTVLF